MRTSQHFTAIAFLVCFLAGCGKDPQPVPVPVPVPPLGSFVVAGKFISVKGEMKSNAVSVETAKAAVSVAVKQLEK